MSADYRTSEVRAVVPGTTMSLTASTAYMNTNFLRVFEERLKRIVEECYEVAFILCNAEMNEFGAAKIFDIFNQIFTTAYCLNTGYWPFYSATTGQCLCNCGRFGVACRHTKSGYHWIDMRPVQHQPGGPVFYPKAYGQVIPMNYDLIIQPIGENGYSYTINLIVNVQYKRSVGRPVRRAPRGSRDAVQTANGDIYSQIHSMQICSRYNVHAEYYPSLFTVVYHPNPFYHEHYGTFFKELLILRNRDLQLFNMEAQTYCFASSEVPSSTFVLQQVNVPTFILPNQISAFQSGAMYSRQKFSRRARSKGCQMPCENIDENCSRMDVASIWNCYSDSSGILSQSLRELATSLSQDFVESRTDGFIELQDSEEYDNQLPMVGYDRVIRPHTISHHPIGSQTEYVFEKPRDVQQGAKRRHKNSTAVRHVPVKTKMVEEFAKSCEEADSTVNEESSGRKCPPLYVDKGTPSTSGLSYSSVLKTFNTAVDQNESDAEWFNKNFPPLKSITTKSDIDREFELIEIVIKEDVENDRRMEKAKREEDADWWKVGSK